MHATVASLGCLASLPLGRLASLALGWLASGALGCGDDLRGTGASLATSNDLFIVAHPDDDLLLMQSDLHATLVRGGGVTTVYVTAGNGADGDYEVAARRYEGVKAAYAYAAGRSDWQCGVLTIAGHAAEHCRIDGVSLVFLGFPDGGRDGGNASSLLRLWRGQIARATTIAYEPTIYDRVGLVAALAEIVRVTEPTTVRTLEVSGSHGRDHADHMATGALTVLALAASGLRPELLSYRGYDIAGEPENKLPHAFDPSFEMLARYEACTSECAACGDACTTVDPTHLTWLQRRYAVGFPQRGRGQLGLAGACLDDGLRLVSCSAAPPWQLDDAGELRVHDRCLTVSADGALSLDLCLGGAERRFFIDDEGHVLSGAAPIVDQTAAGYLACLGAASGRLALVRCGPESAPTWDHVPTIVSTARTAMGIATTGRAVRLGDITGDGLADLCAASRGRLLCAAGNGAGGFRRRDRIDDPGVPLAIEPDSLVLGDVDGDRRVDACGRTVTGITCARAATGFRSEPWSPAFDAASGRAGTAASLAILDADADGAAEICGLDTSGVACAFPGRMLHTEPRSAWPADDAVVWLADLDRDSRADWCASTATGPACAVAAEADITTDGAPWAHARSGVIDQAPANPALVAFGDVDGDRRADLCIPNGERVECARSQGSAFGPRTLTVAVLPPGYTAQALWLGDLDGDGRMDPCIDLGATIACAVQP